ncbi:MAG: methyltransferase domain-containing protein [Gammaproteobacteria bacterium]|jgi:SAM-dependent methyltransferase|nr:methyltransferase domain-containing protein [Gammaproteobacteria bacterium]MDP6733427.1 methyltransferase domain-containing protein [Gammaproteobacteria bacterium]|tara:strand:+ start:148 stop:702 length:555 start_codon:yes stop_codon:yes gene_type:complete
MSHSNTSASRLLVENLSLLKKMEYQGGVLDLACGNGRNGLLLASHKIPVIFADNATAGLSKLADVLHERGLEGRCWEVDLEAAAGEPLTGKCFDAILVFNFLHRPLMPAIRQAIRPGGMIIYETFNTDQVRFGKPTNPDYLLQPGELLNFFEDWETLHYFEGEMSVQNQENRCAKACLVARKPG